MSLSTAFYCRRLSTVALETLLICAHSLGPFCSSLLSFCSLDAARLPAVFARGYCVHEIITC
jgi:hypothetical protein